MAAEGFAPVPSAQLFNDFCRTRVVAKLPPSLAAVLQEEVTALELAPDQGEISGFFSPVSSSKYSARCLCCQRRRPPWPPTTVKLWVFFHLNILLAACPAG